MDRSRLTQNKLGDFPTIESIKLPKIIRHFTWLMVTSVLITSAILIYVPWIQTAFGSGQVIVLDPHDREQNITAMISGRIKRWYVHEGDKVKKGDVLLEMVDNDPDFVSRLTAEKDALTHGLEVAIIAADTAKLNYDRQTRLFNESLASKLEVEKAKINYKKYIAEREKARVALKQSESKLSRQQTQRIVAPDAGTIVNIVAGNTATAFKAGDSVAKLVPTEVSLAAELYVSGLDIALMAVGRKVRLQFEGWPSVQFSGWPSVAIGTFAGYIHSIDPSASPDGKFRILIKPDTELHAWPSNQYLRYGAKVKGWVLLDKVPLGYELWRLMNAFPPEFPEKNKISLKNSSQKNQQYESSETSEK